MHNIGHPQAPDLLLRIGDLRLGLLKATKVEAPAKNKPARTTSKKANPFAAHPTAHLEDLLFSNSRSLNNLRMTRDLMLSRSTNRSYSEKELAEVRDSIKKYEAKVRNIKDALNERAEREARERERNRRDRSRLINRSLKPEYLNTFEGTKR